MYVLCSSMYTIHQLGSESQPLQSNASVTLRYVQYKRQFIMLVCYKRFTVQIYFLFFEPLALLLFSSSQIYAPLEIHIPRCLLRTIPRQSHSSYLIYVFLPCLSLSFTRIYSFNIRSIFSLSPFPHPSLKLLLRKCQAHVAFTASSCYNNIGWGYKKCQNDQNFC